MITCIDMGIVGKTVGKWRLEPRLSEGKERILLGQIMKTFWNRRLDSTEKLIMRLGK